jgi:hypothetical protein
MESGFNWGSPPQDVNRQQGVPHPGTRRAVGVSLSYQQQTRAQVSGSRKGDVFEGDDAFPTKGNKMRPGGTGMLELWLRLRSGVDAGEGTSWCWGTLLPLLGSHRGWDN